MPDWLVHILKQIHAATFAGMIVIWLVMIEPIFTSVAALGEFDLFVLKHAGARTVPIFHLSLSYLLALAAAVVSKAISRWNQDRIARNAERAEDTQQFLKKAKLYSDASPEEKLVLRVFIDNGVERASSRYFGEYLQPLSEANGYSNTQMGQAVMRLKERKLIYQHGDSFSSGYSYVLMDFAFLSENPTLIGSPAPVRHVAG